MKKVNFEELIMKFTEIPELVTKQIELSMKKSAMKVRDDATKKFGEYQPAVGPYPAWETLSLRTVIEKMDRGAESPQPLIGAYGASQYQEGNRVTKNEIWPEHLRNTIGIKAEGLNAAVGTDDPLGKWHEYGTEDERIPPRPFLRPALYENQDTIKNNVKEAIQNGLKSL